MAHRRAPKARPAVHIELRVFIDVITSDEGLHEVDEPCEGEELSAMRMARELEIVAGLGGRVDALRLMREEDLREGARHALERFNGIARLAFDGGAHPIVGAASEDEPFAIALDEARLVAERRDAELVEVLHPLLAAPIIFVVTRGEIDAIAGL